MHKNKFRTQTKSLSLTKTYLIIGLCTAFSACASQNTASETMLNPLDSNATNQSNQLQDSQDLHNQPNFAILDKGENLENLTSAENLAKIASKTSLSQLLIAEVAVANQDFNTAAKIYWQLAQKKQSAQLAQRTLYIAQYVDEKIMLDAARLWAKLAKNDIEAQKTAAGLLLEKALYLESVKYLERLAILQKTSDYMVLINALITRDLKLLPKILPSLHRLEKTIPMSADLATALAFVHHYFGNETKTNAYLHTALKLDKNYLSAILLKANILKREQNFKNAENLLLEALKRNPTQIRIYLNLAKLQIENDKKDLAIKTFNDMLQYAEKDAETSLSLADYLYYAKMYDESYTLAKKLLQTKKYPDATNLLLAKISYEHKDAKKTFAYLNKVVQTPSGFFEAIYLGVIFGKHFYSTDFVINWLEDRKNYATQNLTEDLVEFLVVAYKSLELNQIDMEICKQWLDDAILLAADLGFDDAELIYTRAFYWYKNHKLKFMEADLRTLTQNNEENPKYLNALAYVLVDEDKNLSHSEKTSRYKEGLQLAKKAYAREESLQILDTLGWAFYKNSDFKAAVTYLTQAHQESPKDDEIASHLILALWANGENQAAKELVKKMLNLEQKNTKLKKILYEKPYLKP